MAKPRTLTGHWSGSYAYPAGRGPATPFTAELREEAGRIAGTMEEPDTVFGSTGTLGAILVGSRVGDSVDFTKTYEAAAPLPPIDYVGRLSADGILIEGVWSLEDMDGRFEMRRESGAEAPAEMEVEQTVPVS